jgi:hypothetical protein
VTDRHDELSAAAKVCRVANVMRPYLESLKLTKPAPKNLPASVRQKLTNLAHERNVDFGLILVKYGLERILFR